MRCYDSQKNNKIFKKKADIHIFIKHHVQSKQSKIYRKIFFTFCVGLKNVLKKKTLLFIVIVDTF